MFSFFKKKEPIIEENQISKVEDFNDVDDLASYFYDETGITFTKQKSILKSKLISFCKQRSIYSFETLLECVQTQPSVKQELIDYLTTNETFFYREIKQIYELVELVKSANKNVTILCAPCATGEEPYSIVIALLEAGVNADSFSIVGIDINADAITKAQNAIYKERNVRNLSQEIKNKYFKVEDTHYILDAVIKSHVSFKVMNLFDSSFSSLGKFDFVFSRNMLIYFDHKTKQRAKEILESMRKETQHGVFFGHADLF